jgi:hypothetical protein
LTSAPGLGASKADHLVLSHRWIATAVGASGSPMPPTAHASAEVTAVTPRSVVGASPGFALRTTSHVGVQLGVGDADGVVEGGGGVSPLSEPPAANTTAEPIAKVATAATEAFTRPRR